MTPDATFFAGAPPSRGTSRNQSATEPAISTRPETVRTVAAVPRDLLASYCALSEEELLVGSCRRCWYALSAVLCAEPAHSPPVRSPTPAPPAIQVHMRPPPTPADAAAGRGGSGGAATGGGGAGGTCAIVSPVVSTRHGFSGEPERPGPLPYSSYASR